MNNILKGVLKLAEDIAATQVPGGALIVSGVHKLFDKDKSNNMSAIDDLSSGVPIAIESIKGDEIIDEVRFSLGVAKIRSGFEDIKGSLKKNWE